MTKLPSRDELAEIARLLATPIDFDALTREGVLEKHGGWYLVKDFERLPKGALKRAHAMKSGPDGTLFKFTSESARKETARLYKQFTGKPLE